MRIQLKLIKCLAIAGFVLAPLEASAIGFRGGAVGGGVESALPFRLIPVRVSIDLPRLRQAGITFRQHFQRTGQELGTQARLQEPLLRWPSRETCFIAPRAVTAIIMVIRFMRHPRPVATT